MKRIITCSDGTWNKPNGMYNGKPVRTNVQKIFESICNRDDLNVNQIKYYDEGIGAEGGFFSQMIHGATGKGIDQNIIDIYKFIIWNYELGDEIYLFGFSRGAYTARSLAGLIRNSGILKNNDLVKINEAYKIYRDRNNKRLYPKGDEAISFREKYAHEDMRIKFIGVWDTVGSLGIPSRWFQWFNNRKYQFHDTKLSSSVEYAYQALAIDERRSNFQPTLWQLSDKVKDNQVQQVMEQVWFTGVHSNIGGGYDDEGLSDIALNWMIEKATGAGLGFDQKYIEANIKQNENGMLYNSNKFPFSLLPDYVRPVKKAALSNENICPLVFERVKNNEKYKPENLKDWC
ncbi:DUF2235 domain-containing protein [Daejeonella oryzae]|uniref:DUF2235 domain-containing protein n=1 Tax=Daejeonella oryzae TaxID=1122943 RepID=UPI0003FC761C|nr:DUF2235 domain-containing protein [Daejeonella oryzae]